MAGEKGILFTIILTFLIIYPAINFYNVNKLESQEPFKDLSENIIIASHSQTLFFKSI